MIYSKPIQVDLAHQYLNDVIRLHEGDALGAQLQISMYNNGDVFSLAGFTIKYDAVIAGYLAEQDATATVLTGTSNVIVVPITENMCAKSGTLEIDVKLKKTADNSVLFLQKFEAFVQRRVINEDVIIDVSGTTIGAKIAALEAKFPVATADIADAAVTPAKLDRTYYRTLSIDSADVDTATDNDIAYKVSLDGRTNYLFCVNSGSNLRAQYRFDTQGYCKYRKQSKLGDEWQAWSAWTELASNSNIASGAVTTSKIADGNVTADKLGSGAVTSGKIAPGAVTTGKIDSGAVGTTKLADGAVTEAKIGNAAVTSNKIDADAVGTTKIVDNAVTTAKIASGAVTTGKIDSGAVTKAKLGSDVKEVYMTLLDQIGTMYLADDFEIGQMFLYNTDALRVVAKVGPSRYITLARQDELSSLASVVGDANDLLESALNYQS